jgi:hypothetical protein
MIMAYGFKTGGRAKGARNKKSKLIQEALELYLEDAVKEIPKLFNDLASKEKVEYLIKLMPYAIPRKTERYFVDETEIPDQPIFIENTMVVSDSKYNEMKENGRIDDDGNLIKE